MKRISWNSVVMKLLIRTNLCILNTVPDCLNCRFETLFPRQTSLFTVFKHATNFATWRRWFYNLDVKRFYVVFALKEWTLKTRKFFSFLDETTRFNVANFLPKTATFEQHLCKDPLTHDIKISPKFFEPIFYCFFFFSFRKFYGAKWNIKKLVEKLNRKTLSRVNWP